MTSLSWSHRRARPWALFERYIKAERAYHQAQVAGDCADWNKETRMAANSALAEVRASKEAIDRLR